MTDLSKWDIPEGEFCIFGKVFANPEKADELEAIYADTARAAQSEPGIVHYTIARDREERSVFHFFERYTSKEAFAAHNSLPVIRKLLNPENNFFRDVEAKFMKPVGL
ncbi:hypothetical protein F4808DRAFT_430880 [Astrocystis sublimbata]|nr:hypothetical protein F4808DRAFT_430880 [Astrocystis sublimbata]